MRKIFIIGIGAGNPDHLTVQAINALNQVDVVFVMDKGQEKDDLVRLRKEICERFIKDRPYRFVETADPRRDPAASYETAVRVWHEQRAAIYERLIGEELGDDGCGAFLVWGDPSLYDSTLRIIDQLIERGEVVFEHEVIPGITAVQALAAGHKIALNRIGKSVHITTGRKLADGLPDGIDDVVVCSTGIVRSRRSTLPASTSIGAPMSAPRMKSSSPVSSGRSPIRSSLSAPQRRRARDG